MRAISLPKNQSSSMASLGNIMAMTIWLSKTFGQIYLKQLLAIIVRAFIRQRGFIRQRIIGKTF
jgi:hypothetical protein